MARMNAVHPSGFCQEPSTVQVIGGGGGCAEVDVDMLKDGEESWGG